MSAVFAITAVFLARCIQCPAATVAFLNVGQGDAALIAAGRVQALVDGGPGRQVLAGLGRAMPPTDRFIEYVIVTHPHADHVGGLAAVFDRYRVGRLILGGPGAATPEFAALRAVAVSQGVPVSVVRTGDTISLGADVSLKVLHAAKTSITNAHRDINEESLVLMFRVHGGAASDRAAGGRVLLMGDAGAGIEAELAGGGADLAADAVKIGHHGSRQATTVGFLEAVGPRAAVISVGRNHYGHPSPTLVKRLSARAIRIWRTDRDGDVRAVFAAGGGVKVSAGSFPGRAP